MDIYFRVKLNEIEQDENRTFYNHIMWKIIRPNKIGITHITEIYDDVSDYPTYELGKIVDGKFKTILTGEGDPIDDSKIGVGGVFTDIFIHYPEFFIRI